MVRVSGNIVAAGSLPTSKQCGPIVWVALFPLAACLVVNLTGWARTVLARARLHGARLGRRVAHEAHRAVQASAHVRDQVYRPPG